MGTRHRQAVIDKAGDLKIQQYGQWDGYPSGQGIEILDFLRNGDLGKFQVELSKIRIATKEDYKLVEGSNDWKKEYPHLSRDCGSAIYKLIQEGKINFVQHIEESEAQEWCTGFYTIDFNKGVFIAEFYGVSKTYNLNNLPSDEDFIAHFEED